MLPCCRLVDHRSVDLFLISLFCSIDLYVCFCASKRESFLRIRSIKKMKAFLLYLFSNRGDHVGGAKGTGGKDLAIHWKESTRGNGLWGLSCFGREVKTRTWSIV